MFDQFISQTQSFLRMLTQNNNRDWFLANKETYDQQLKGPAAALLEEMTPRLRDMTGFDIAPKLFRPHRDVRFSKDKTPYKTHLHMLWRVNADARQDPVFFFGIDTSQVTVGTGMMEFEKDVLADWRKMVDLDGGYVQGKVDAALAQGYQLWDPKLKRVPAPFAKDHAHADLLRHKGLVVMGHPTLSSALVDDLEDAYRQIWPVSDMLVGLAEAPVI